TTGPTRQTSNSACEYPLQGNPTVTLAAYAPGLPKQRKNANLDRAGPRPSRRQLARTTIMPQPGDRVLATRLDDEFWYPGTVRQRDGERSHVLFDDGSEGSMPDDQIMPLQID